MDSGQLTMDSLKFLYCLNNYLKRTVFLIVRRPLSIVHY